jgi:hypothetical protein
LIERERERESERERERERERETYGLAPHFGILASPCMSKAKASVGREDIKTRAEK